MPYRQANSRTILQRRGSLSQVLQQFIDAVSVIGLVLALVHLHLDDIGGKTTPYAIMLLMLLGVLAVMYDKYAIYRSNGNFGYKAVDLLKAWTITFMVLVVIAYLTKVSHLYSRQLIGQLYVFGYITQLILHIMFKEIYLRIVLPVQEKSKVLIIG
jgi:putative colanic acid biosynthesis UDP-glucose lipid carrier transferase